MHTPFRQRANLEKLSSIKNPLTNNKKNFFAAAIVILIASLMKIFIKIDRVAFVNYYTYLTGLPFLRNNTLVLPVIINIIAVIEIFLAFSKKKNELKDLRFDIFISKMKLAYSGTNIGLIIVFFMLYNQLYTPYFEYSAFRLSGHTLAILVKNTILINVMAVCMKFIELNMQRKHMVIINFCCRFLVFHGLYTLFWTALVYHTFTEMALSFVFAFFYIALVNALSLDNLVMTIINPRLHILKEKNVLSK